MSELRSKALDLVNKWNAQYDLEQNNFALEVEKLDPEIVDELNGYLGQFGLTILHLINSLTEVDFTRHILTANRQEALYNPNIDGAMEELAHSIWETWQEANSEAEVKKVIIGIPIEAIPNIQDIKNILSAKKLILVRGLEQKSSIVTGIQQYIVKRQ